MPKVQVHDLVNIQNTTLRVFAEGFLALSRFVLCSNDEPQLTLSCMRHIRVPKINNQSHLYRPIIANNIPHTNLRLQIFFFSLERTYVLLRHHLTRTLPKKVEHYVLKITELLHPHDRTSRFVFLLLIIIRWSKEKKVPWQKRFWFLVLFLWWETRKPLQSVVLAQPCSLAMFDLCK